jgi:hypothetical protein
VGPRVEPAHHGHDGVKSPSFGLGARALLPDRGDSCAGGRPPASASSVVRLELVMITHP